jgi:molybdenum cofactor cytidylyltransferase
MPRLALTGAGGKTSAMFQIAHELAHITPVSSSKSVLLTATTHLATEQLTLANQHYFITSLDDIAALDMDMPSGIILLTGPAVDDGRTAGLDDLLMRRVLELADAQGLPLLIEADGSRQLPVKAPAEHEPVVPEWVTTVVVVAGLSALGQSLSSNWVHRPERFSELSGLHAGDEITLDALAKVLSHPQGGLKGIPNGARRVLLLNQADTPELQAAGQRLAKRLQAYYPAVVLAALQTRPQGSNVFIARESCAGIVLAAGGSSRLGQPKQLLDWHGKPLVWHAACKALNSGLSPVLVVIGAHAAEVETALHDLPVIITHNPNWQAGQSTSVVRGVAELPPEIGSAIFLLADQPQVSETLIRSLKELHRRTLAPIIAPQIGGRRANPVLFDRVTFSDLSALSGDTGGRALFSRYRVEWLPWHDETLLLDVDTPDDYQRLLELRS